MSEKLAAAYVEVSARLDSLEKDLRQGVRVTEQETQKMAGLGTRAASMAASGLAAAATAGVAAVGLAGAGIVAVTQQGIAAFGDFEKGMNEVFTLIPGISGEAMESMKGQVLDLSKEMNILPQEVIPALYAALSAGVPQENVFEFLKTAQMSAKAGVTDLNTAVEGIASVVNAYGAEAISASRASDLMIATVQKGITTFPELSAALSQVTPTASELGVSFEEVSAWIAQMTAMKIPTATATSSIRAALVELRQESTKVSGVFQEISGVSFREFIAQGNTVADALKLLEQYAKDNDTSIGNLFGSVEAGNAVLSVTGEKMGQFAEGITDMGNAAGNTQTAYEQMAQGVNEQMKRVQVAIQNALIGVGDAVQPALGPIVDKLIEIIEIAEQELTPAFAAVGEALGLVDPDVSGVRSLFVAVADGMVAVVDSLLAVSYALDEINVNLDTVVAAAKWWIETGSKFTVVGIMRSTTQEEREKRGQSAEAILERLRQARDELAKKPPEEKQADKEQQKATEDNTKATKDLTEETKKKAAQEKQDKPDPVKQAMLEKAMQEMEEDRQRILDMEGPQRPQLAEQGFIGIQEFGRRLQEQILEQEKQRKEEAFRRQVEQWEKMKQDLLKRNADGTKRIADALEKVKVATT